MSLPIVRNLGTNYTLYYNALDYFKTIMSNHPSIQSVTMGDIDTIDDNQFPMYPLGNVLVTNAIFGETTTTFTIQLIIADKQKLLNNESEGVTNKQIVPFYGVDDMVDIHANTLAILNDLTSYTQNGVYAFEIPGDIVCEPFSDRFNNGLAGWVATFDLIVHNNRNRCLYELFPTTTTTTTIAPTTTTTTAPPQQVHIYLSAIGSGSGDVGLWYRTNTPQFLGLGDKTPATYPSYSLAQTLNIPPDEALRFGVTNLATGSILFGTGSNSGQFISNCGLTNPTLIPAFSWTGSIDVFINIETQTGSYQLC